MLGSLGKSSVTCTTIPRAWYFIMSALSRLFGTSCEIKISCS